MSRPTPAFTAEPVRGAAYGLTAAALFGLSAPLAKLLVPTTGPLVLAGLLYLGAGLGLSLWLAVRDRLTPGSIREAPLRTSDIGPLAGVVLFGGVLGPLLLFIGLSRVSAVAGSLLLNLEVPFTILLAVLLFHEHLGLRGLAATAVIVTGAAMLGYRPGELRLDGWGTLAIAGACLSWAVDNNLTQGLSLKEPLAVVRIKGLGAGVCSLMLALVTGQRLPAPVIVAAAMTLGLVSYGASVVLHVHALRILGASRQAALFATAPFVGALAAVPLLGERMVPADAAAMAVLAAGVALLLREEHRHTHTHERTVHEHLHVHDEHHQHQHEEPVTEPHSHVHAHLALTHDHPHLPDLHHRHRHRDHRP